MFDPTPFQPLSVYFDMEIGGLSKIYSYPNIPVAMELTLPTKEAPTVVFTLFDEAAKEVEPYLWEGRDPATGYPGGTFQFGYKGEANVDSQKFSFAIQDVNPQYVNNAFSITIYAFITSATPITSSNQLCGTPEQILDQFCKIHKMELEISPPFGKDKMMDIGRTGRNTTEKQEMKFSKNMSYSDWRFINKLLYYCVDQEGKPGYVARLMDDNGSKKLKVVKVQDSSADYTYKFQDTNGVVKEWNPKVSYIPLLDEADTQVNGIQAHTGYEYKQAMNQKLTQDKATLFGKDVYQVLGSLPEKDPPSKIDHICAENMEDQVVNGSMRQRSAPSRTPYGGSLPALYKHIQRWMDLNSAELVVLGDPRIDSVTEQALTLVEVEFNIPVNYFNTTANERHYTSGIYPVDSVTHSVAAGTYLTTYQLGRPMFWEEPKPGEGYPKPGNQ